MSTPQQIEFINKFGLPAWEKLPAHRAASIAPSKEMTRAQYMAMPMRDRMAFSRL